MQTDRTTLPASLIVVGTGTLWGFYWLPVRRLVDTLPGAWGTLAIVAAAAAILAPFALARRRTARIDPLALASIALGGAGFVLYSIGFVYGRVAIVILLFYLTPVWSTLIGRYVMGWHTPRLRIVAIAIGIAGLAVMLGADGRIPVPRGTGEWLALLSGLLWSVATTGIRSKAAARPAEAAFVFALGACAGALAFAPFLEPFPARLAARDILPTIGWAVGAGSLWWGLSIAALMWATPRLEPARIGILLMAEVLVGAVSAALLAGEHLGTVEIIGGALVLISGVLEVWPVRQGGRAGAR
ncbi:EamA/RhaT family transporter [Rhodobacteraceae bacterium WD3A24]|nr:EamA/RhaT family transporter [Rhodobacteraceae bacterium WD3A24]